MWLVTVGATQYLIVHVVQVQLLAKHGLHFKLDLLKLHWPPKHQDPAAQTQETRVTDRNNRIGRDRRA